MSKNPQEDYNLKLSLYPVTLLPSRCVYATLIL